MILQTLSGHTYLAAMNRSKLIIAYVTLPPPPKSRRYLPQP